MKKQSSKPIMLWAPIWALLGIILVTGKGYSQLTKEQEAKFNAQADSVIQASLNLPAHEKKIDSFILQQINKMIKENAKNAPDMSKKYSVSGMPVDSNGRVLINVMLPRGSSFADTSIIVRQILREGGKIKIISRPKFDYPIEINCWVPYEKVKEIAKLDKVSNISSIGIWETQTVR